MTVNQQSWISCSYQSCASRRISLVVTGLNGESHRIVDARTVKNLDLPTQSVNMSKLRENWNHLKRVNLEDLVVAKPRILIGMDNWDLLLTSYVIRGPKNGPAVSRTKLGWVLHGNVAEVQHRVETVFNIWGEEEDSLHQLVKKSFATEDFGVKLLDKLTTFQG